MLSIERTPALESSALLTPRRIAGATSRMRRKFVRACGRADSVLGERSAAWDLLRRRIDTLAEVTTVSLSTAANGVHVSRLTLELTPAATCAARVQSLATAMLALVQAIEAEDSSARLIAADLAGIVTDADLVVAALVNNRAAFERHDVAEVDETVDAEPDTEDLDALAA